MKNIQIFEDVLYANQELSHRNLVVMTWGNASARDAKSGNIIIKPSGVSYNKMRVDDLTYVDINGNVISGDLKPSCDLPTHLAIYKKYPEIGGVVHTHSPYATAFAQAGRSIPILGTTHADYCNRDIPCTRDLKYYECGKLYEINTAKAIIEAMHHKNVLDFPGILVKSHGVFCWGQNVIDALNNATAVEEIARMAYLTLNINPNVNPLAEHIIRTHYERKHGQNAYYGQKKQKVR